MAVIITDSTSDLTLAQAEELGVEMLSLRVHFGAESYLDKREITNEEFYEKLAAAKELPTTSLLNPEDFIEAFNRHPAEEILVITISSELSGTYQSAVIARETLGRTDISIVDSRCATAALAMLVRIAVQMNAKGMPMPQIAGEMRRLAAKARIIGIVDTLKYLVKGGRLNKVSGYLGGILHIKPILMVRTGTVEPVSKARGDKDAYAQILQLVFEKYPLDTSLPVAFASSEKSRERTESFMRALGLTGPVSTLGSVVGTHAGPGAIILAYFEI